MGDLVNELLAAIRAIPEFKHVVVWNNQFAYMEDGGDYAFPMPCAFIELQTNNLQDIGEGYEGSDISFVLHIGQNVLNSDYMEQNLTIFELRDLVVKALKPFQASTSLMTKVNEQQDYDHSNVYHYMITYNLHFIDNTTATPQYFTVPPVQSILNKP